MPTIGRTPNFALALPYGNRQNWTDLINGNLRTLDALIATYVSVTNLQGLWTNNTEYTVGDNVVDETAGVVYTAQVDHTSSGAPTTFLEERTNNPTYWLTFAVAARNRGAWQTNTAYALNDFVLADGTKYAMCVSAHTSGATFAGDLALGYWTVLVDLTAAGSLVLPVLSGALDANKVVVTDSAGTAYAISSMSALAALLQAAGLAPIAAPAFSGNPTAPTPTAEDNDTSIATTAYTDTAVRAVITRVQTFTVNGTYTPHAKMVWCTIECWGGGGGGGGSANSSASQQSTAGTGGAGAYSRATVSRATIAGSQVVTVGPAGAAGAAGNNAGTSGGSTSVGALCSAGGGGGGSGASGSGSAGTKPGGAGGAAGTGDIAAPGMNGANAIDGTSTSGFVSHGGQGGSTLVGQGGVCGVLAAPGATAGTAATGRGAGGGGGVSAAAGGTAAGGAGTGGLVVITEFCYG